MAQIEVGKELQLQYDISPTCLKTRKCITNDSSKFVSQKTIKSLGPEFALSL